MANPEQLARLKQELETARSRAYREAQLAASKEVSLLEQRDYFKQQAEKLSRWAAELEGMLKAEKSKGDSLEPATLLNRLRAKNPKSKATLKDIELLRELIRDPDDYY